MTLDKPGGITSFDVVARIRQVAGQRRVGHAGTLDPMATGVLVVCLGQATRAIPYLMDQPKAYRADVTFGVETDTYDAEGQVVAQRDAADLSVERIEWALAGFRGPIEQTPPMYSALKRGGRRLYELARAGVDVERAPRRIEIFELRLVAWFPPVATLDVRCSKGTYIRSLAHDLGERLRTGAMLSRLVRTASGPFRLDDAWALAAVEEAYRRGEWPQVLTAPDEGVLDWPAVLVGPAAERRLRSGQEVGVGGQGSGVGGSMETEHPLGSGQPVGVRARDAVANRCRAYSAEGKLIAFLRCMGQMWRPETVFTPEDTDTAL